MATELDALQLNFSASTSQASASVDRLIGSLNRLGQSIGAINTQGFTVSANNIITGLSNISDAAMSVDSGKIKEISSSMKSLATASKNLTGVENISSSFAQLANGFQLLNGVNLPDIADFTAFANSINRLGTGNITAAAAALPQLATAIESFKSVSFPNLEGVEQFAQGLRSLGSKSIQNAAASLPPIAEALNAFSTITIPSDLGGLSELASSLSMFGRQTAQQAVDTIPRLATAFRDLIATLATAPAVSRNVIDLANALAQFVTNVNRVGSGSTNASKGLNLFGNTATNVTKKTFSLASAIGKIYATYFLLFRAFRLVGKAINISSDLTEVQNVVDTTFGNMSYKAEEFAKTSIKSFGLSELSAKEFSSRFQAMGTAMGITSDSVAKAQQKLNTLNIQN